MKLKSRAVAVSILIPGLSWACGCGCSLFDVKTSSMLPTGEGGTAYMEYNYVNQSRNWSGSSQAPAEDNGDKQIRTEFYTLGAQYMFNSKWGIITEVPYANRYFKTTDADSGDIVSVKHSGLGDVRIKGVYSGFSSFMASGLTFGLKLPTGDFKKSGFDRDTQIGTGSTDLLLGGFLRGALPIGDNWNWFATGQLDQPFLIQDDYRPGAEINGVAGMYYNGWTVGGVKIAPVAQAIASHHWHDRGSEAHTADSGYDRFYLSPGIEIDKGNVSLYADVAMPVYEHYNGNQLEARELFTVRLSYSF